MDAQQHGQDNQDHAADDGDRGILAVEVGAGAFLDRRGDFLHPGGSGIGCQHLLGKQTSVTYGPEAAE